MSGRRIGERTPGAALFNDNPTNPALILERPGSDGETRGDGSCQRERLAARRRLSLAETGRGEIFIIVQIAVRYASF